MAKTKCHTLKTFGFSRMLTPLVIITNTKYFNLQVASQSAAYTESAAYTDPMDAFNFDKPTYEYFTPLRLRPGAQKKSPGYHAELVCLTPWVNGVPPEGIKCLTINANFGLMAYGNGSGLVIGQAHHMF